MTAWGLPRTLMVTSGRALLGGVSRGPTAVLKDQRSADSSPSSCETSPDPSAGLGKKDVGS